MVVSEKFRPITVPPQSRSYLNNTTIHSMSSQSFKGESGWVQWFPQSHTCPELQSAREVVGDSKEFLRTRLRKLGRKESVALTTILSHSKRRGQVSPSKSRIGVFDALEELSLDELSSYVNDQVAMMKIADDHLESRRSKGLHRVATRAQSLTVAFDRFLKAYSGVVDIVNLADAQYGNVASSTLSLFYSMIITKVDAERSIRDAMMDIADRLPEYRIYGRIFPDKEFGKMLADAYGTIIKFARNVTVYLQGHGIWRFTSQLVHVGKFEAMCEDMTRVSNRVIRRSDVLLAEMVDRLEKDNEELRKRDDVRLVKDIRNLLNVQEYQLESTLRIFDNYRRFIKPQFDNDRRRDRMTLERLYQVPEYKAWRAPESSMLLLFGRNEQSREATRHSWLSPVLMEVAESLLTSEETTEPGRNTQSATVIDSRNNIAFEDCNERSTLDGGLSRLIFQLLQRNPKLLRLAHDFDYVESHIAKSQNCSDGNHEVRVESLRDALLRIVNIHHRTVHLIVNRPDQCNGEEESCSEYLSVLAWLVQRATVELKILVVVKGEQWDYNRRKKELDVPADVEKFHVVEINQRRL
ncbi:unnamed protein product [Periconia digitata]|uniref:DUF7708 domain-containing protein n=1 Tax=Periconia digitata TaxID=1303443 RepID=A0A9W4UJV4_9PLEO|nr:unnamed protein product [Periconia digitata]